MRRTKQWWAALTAEEQGELRRLGAARGISLDGPYYCHHCHGVVGRVCHAGLCDKCNRRYQELIAKADTAMEDFVPYEPETDEERAEMRELMADIVRDRRNEIEPQQ